MISITIMMAMIIFIVILIDDNNMFLVFLLPYPSD